MRTLVSLSPIDFLWIMIGVILTVICTLVPSSVPEAIPVIGGYKFSLQIGGVLLTACIGGAGVGFYAQMFYILLGLAGLQVFSFGGGLEYMQQPTFGYLLGFIPGSWVCGFLAFRPITLQSQPTSSQQQPLLTNLSSSKLLDTPPSGSLIQQFRDVFVACVCGLGVIHLTGLAYLSAQTVFSGRLAQLAIQHSLFQLPGQLIVISGVTSLAVLSRRLLLY